MPTPKSFFPFGWEMDSDACRSGARIGMEWHNVWLSAAGAAAALSKSLNNTEARVWWPGRLLFFQLVHVRAGKVVNNAQIYYGNWIEQNCVCVERDGR